jgi:hypothetical protein
VALSHVKSNAVADAAGVATVWWGASTQTINATDLVRPSDWNSAHNETFALSGNTNNASTASGTNVVLSAKGEFSLGGSTATIVLSGKAPLSSWEPFPMQGAASTSFATFTLFSASSIPNGTHSLFGMPVGEAVSVGAVDLIFSLNRQGVAFSHGATQGYWVGLYTQGTGASTSLLSRFTERLLQIIESDDGAVNAQGSFSMPTSTAFSGYGTAQVTVADLNNDTRFTGQKRVAFPLNTLLTAGMYWFAFMGSISVNSEHQPNLLINVYGASIPGLFQSLAPMGSLSSAYSTGRNDPIGRWYPAHGSWSSVGSQQTMPDSIPISQISAGALVYPYLLFWST